MMQYDKGICVVKTWPWYLCEQYGRGLKVTHKVYQPLSSLSRTGKLNAYRADTGTSASDKDGLAEQSGCVENGHRRAEG